MSEKNGVSEVGYVFEKSQTSKLDNLFSFFDGIILQNNTLFDVKSRIKNTYESIFMYMLNDTIEKLIKNKFIRYINNMYIIGTNKFPTVKSIKMLFLTNQNYKQILITNFTNPVYERFKLYFKYTKLKNKSELLVNKITWLDKLLDDLSKQSDELVEQLIVKEKEAMQAKNDLLEKSDMFYKQKLDIELETSDFADEQQKNKILNLRNLVTMQNSIIDIQQQEVTQKKQIIETVKTYNIIVQKSIQSKLAAKNIRDLSVSFNQGFSSLSNNMLKNTRILLKQQNKLSSQLNEQTIESAEQLQNSQQESTENLGENQVEISEQLAMNQRRIAEGQIKQAKDLAQKTRAQQQRLASQLTDKQLQIANQLNDNQKKLADQQITINNANTQTIINSIENVIDSVISLNTGFANITSNINDVKQAIIDMGEKMRVRFEENQRKQDEWFSTHSYERI